MDVSLKTGRFSEDQVNTAAGVLARAFHKDPPFVYFVPDNGNLESNIGSEGSQSHIHFCMKLASPVNDDLSRKRGAPVLSA
jgi:hypothetical protein